MLEAGADDVQDNDDTWEVRTSMADFNTVREALEGQGVEMMEAQVLYIACVGSAAKRLYENVRHARDTAQVDMAVRSDMADSFVCCHESDVCHLS